MTDVERIYAQALLLAGPLEPQQEERLGFLCRTTARRLARDLRPGLTPKDCLADFVAAAGLYALAALAELDETGQVEQVSAGDFTLRRAAGAPAVRCLLTQAELIMAPYMNDGFSFRGV